MIRSALSILAKKTAVVAVSGVVVIGGAGFALAELDAEAPDTSCDIAETADVVEACEVVDDTTTTTEAVDDTTTTTEVEETTTTTEAEPEDTTTTSEPEGTEEGEEEDELETLADDAPASEELEDDSHGAMVSEAAKTTCWEPENIEAYGNHGQCVRAFAQGEGVDHSAEAVAEEPAMESTTETEAPAEEPVVEEAAEVQQTESAKPGKGNAGGGKGNGKGKKG